MLSAAAHGALPLLIYQNLSLLSDNTAPAKEPSWHRNERERRARARASIREKRARRAARLLRVHHGTPPDAYVDFTMGRNGGRRTVGEDGWSLPSASRDRFPTWGCSCGTDGNWATRATCRSCGKRGPVFAGRGQAGGGGKASSSPQARGAWANGPPSLRAESAEVIKLRRRVAELEKSRASGKQGADALPEDEGKDGAEPASLAGLLDERARLLRRFASDDPIILLLDKRIASAREERDQNKTVGSKLRDAERLVDKKRKALATANEKLEAAQNALNEAQSIAETRTEELVAAESAVRIFRSETLRHEPGGASAAAVAVRELQHVLGDDAGEHIQAIQELLAQRSATASEEFARREQPVPDDDGDDDEDLDALMDDAVRDFREAAPGSSDAAISSFRKGIKLSIRKRGVGAVSSKVKKASAASHGVGDVSAGFVP